MSFKSSDSATAVVAAASWFCLSVVSFLAVWNFPEMRLWFRLPLGLALAMVGLGYAIESLAQEMTVRRWAIGQLVFSVFAIVFIVAGAFDANVFHLNRWVLVGAGSVLALAAILSAAAAKDLF